VQSLQRSIRVLLELSHNPDGLALGKLAVNTGLHKSTVSRILKTLKEFNFAKQDNESGKYFLGLGILELTYFYLSGMDLRKAALPHMRVLNEKTQETVNLAVLDEFNIIYIERIESRQMLRTTSPVGKRTPAFCTALGKAILAFANEDTIHRSLYGDPLVKLTPLTLNDPMEIRQVLDRVKGTGIALDDRENQEDVRCIASPIFDARDYVIAAVSISAPASRINFGESEELQSLVRSTAHAISSDMGWTYSESY
jgi:DNA-binding IclR family transcriptional regulator